MPNYKKKTKRRTQIINGQIKGLQKMIENDEYCIDILIQSLAIQKSLKSISKLVLENHMQTHVADGMKTGSKQEQDILIAELVKIYELTNNRG